MAMATQGRAMASRGRTGRGPKMAGTRGKAPSSAVPLVESVRETPFGLVRLAASARGLARVWIGGSAKASLSDGPDAVPLANSPASAADLKQARAHLATAEKALTRWLAKDAKAWDAVPLDLAGLSEHRLQVFTALRKLPMGETRTYGELARLAGKPGAARAIGTALARNPVPLAIPCHRILGSTGALHGFSSGGGEGPLRHELGLKKALLAHEGVGT